eukprot:1891337-Rhodomonas_salina.1
MECARDDVGRSDTGLCCASQPSVLDSALGPLSGVFEHARIFCGNLSRFASGSGSATTASPPTP